MDMFMSVVTPLVDREPQFPIRGQEGPRLFDRLSTPLKTILTSVNLDLVDLSTVLSDDLLELLNGMGPPARHSSSGAIPKGYHRHLR